MLRAYYDASGTHEGSEALTLAGMVASESVWDRFEEQWGAVLGEYQISQFHTKDAMACRGQFAQKNNWDRQRTEKLIWELWKVIGAFRAVKNSPDSNLTATSCTIVMKDYVKAKIDNPALRKPEAICVQFCATRMPADLDAMSDFPEYPEVALVFDQNESFLHTIYRVWQDYKSRAHAGWPRQMNIMTNKREINLMGKSYIYPLQAADLLAWTMNHNYRSIHRTSWALVPSLAVEHHTRTYDYVHLMSEFPNG